MRGRHEKYPHSESLDPRGDGAEVSDASGPRDAVSDHRRIEERSIALHAAVAEKLRRDPRLIEIARKSLERQSRRFTCEGQQPPRWLLEWQAILDRRSLEEILDFMTSPDEKARELRQSSPFAGILTPRERWKIHEAFGPGTHHPRRR